MEETSLVKVVVDFPILYNSFQWQHNLYANWDIYKFQSKSGIVQCGLLLILDGRLIGPTICGYSHVLRQNLGCPFMDASENRSQK